MLLHRKAIVLPSDIETIINSSGRQWFSWIHIDDLVGLYRVAINDPSITGVLNAASPEPAQQRDVARALGRALHRPAWLPTPTWAIRLVLWDQATLVLGSRRVVPPVSKKAMTKREII